MVLPLLAGCLLSPPSEVLGPLACLSSWPTPGSCERLFDPPWQWDLHSSHSAHSAHPSLELFGAKQGLWDHLPWHLIEEIRKQGSEGAMMPRLKSHSLPSSPPLRHVDK